MEAIKLDFYRGYLSAKHGYEKDLQRQSCKEQSRGREDGADRRRVVLTASLNGQRKASLSRSQSPITAPGGASCSLVARPSILQRHYDPDGSRDQ
ncbi:hypothetical protein RRG08_008236 [Elysia crispata]|uniref:Uncharacterized protein n=1 Tax=Elysia crispata TaxID=231223 RepID=A0AAE0YB91_9GAST|nr:hypothetical protein RRG08_008236 [Elysia crispata]